jgi:hypothetical protein
MLCEVVETTRTGSYLLVGMQICPKVRLKAHESCQMIYKDFRNFKRVDTRGSQSEVIR